MLLHEARIYREQVAELVKSSPDHEARRLFLRSLRNDWEYVEAKKATVKARVNLLLERRIQEKMYAFLDVDERSNFTQVSGINEVTRRNEQPEYFELGEYFALSPAERNFRYSLYPRDGDLYEVYSYVRDNMRKTLYGLVPKNGQPPRFFDFCYADSSYQLRGHTLYNLDILRGVRSL